MDDDVPSPFIKKRTKAVRPSGSTSSLRSLSFQNDGDEAATTTSGRASVATSENGDGDDGNVAVVRARTKKTAAGRLKDREGLGKPKSRLSFGAAQEDEDSDSNFAIRREAGTPRKLLRAPASQSSNGDGLPTSLDQATISASTSSSTPARSIYSKEYLDQLKATTNSAPSTSSRRRDEGYDDLTMSKFGSRMDENMSDEIPTTAAIASAREKREQMRAAGLTNPAGDRGFISLDVGFANKSGESRLVREEDEIGDGDEELASYTGSTETVPLGKKANKEAARKMKSDMMDLIQDAEDDMGEEDDEMREWEEAQIRRGGDAYGQRDDRREDRGKTAWRAAPSEHPLNLRLGGKSPYLTLPPAVPTSSTLPTLATVSIRLQTSLSGLQTSHQVDKAALDHFNHERAELDAQEKELREEVAKVSEKNRWFAEFKGFVEELAAFLDDKFPTLERIEKENLAIQKERFEIVSRRRYECMSDDVALFTGAAVASAFHLPPIDGAEGNEAPPDPALPPRSAEREQRRQAKLRRFAARRPQPASSTSVLEEEDAWTDDELSTGDSADLSDALQTLKDSLASLFADVKVDDFRDPNLGVRRRFEEWRARYTDDYQNAFAGLALVGVWEFWARVEMALWNPFEIDQLARTPVGLDSYRWHQNLTEYGHEATAVERDAGQGDEDEAQVIVNALVTSVVIPRLDKFARDSFDPFSRKQTTRALGLMDEVSYGVERDSSRFHGLLLAFMGRIQLLIVQAQSLVAPHLAAIALPQNAFDPSTFGARNAFANRQVKLLQNSLRWRRWCKSLRLSDGAGGLGPTLDELLVRELVAKVILPVVEAGWATGGSDIAAKVLNLLPSDVVPPALKRRLEREK